ncbi:FecR family protein, partial [Parasphingorhabdus sp.]|uniref:FecR family protein n=1 Tax=Parasphingorhabdus sp. TaxID=2709688 RepID=UPI003002AE21
MQKMKLFLSLAALVTAGSAHAGTPQWKLSESAGTVNVLRSGVSKIAISGGSLSAGDVITTGTKSRAVLVRGQEYVVVSPNSRLRISAPEQSGGVVQFFEELGNVLFRIDKKATPHFGVKTPYLAAVVKGTTFSVTVTESGTAVQVTEGAVQVSTLDGGATQLLSPGMIGMVDQSQQFRLTIAGTESRIIDSPNAPAGSTEKPEPMDEASLVEIANSDFEGSITAPVLETPVSLSNLTGGLVSNGVATPVPTQFAALNPSITGITGGPSGVTNGNPGAVGRANAVSEAGNVGGNSNAGGKGDAGVNGNADVNDSGNGNGNGNNGNGNGNGGAVVDAEVGVNVGGNGNGNNGNGNGNGGAVIDAGVGVNVGDNGSASGNGNAGNNSNDGNGGSGPNYGGDQPDGTCNGVPNCRSGPNPNSNGNGGAVVDAGVNVGGNGNGNNGNGNGNGGAVVDAEVGVNVGGNGNGNNGNGNGNGGAVVDAEVGVNVGGNGNGNNGNGNGNGGAVVDA